MASSPYTNQTVNHDNYALSRYNSRLCNYDLENSMEWKISLRSPIRKTKPLPQEPCLSKKTKPLPTVPHYYSQLHSNHFANYFASETPCAYKAEEQYIATPLRHYSPQLDTSYSPFPLIDCYPSFDISSSVSSDESFDKGDLEVEGTSHDFLEITSSISPQQEDSETGSGERQFTVKSVDGEHRVWINIEPKETGESVAKKIHALATFRTQKVLTITTSSGRKIPLNKTPLFRNWEDMDNFKNGETWTYTCGPLKKSAVDNFLSKIMQVK